MKQSIAYKIPYQQWKILMACGNVKQMYGVTFEDEPLSEREMLLQLHDMVQKGMLCILNERLVPRGVYEYMLGIIRKTEHFFSFEYIRDDSLKRGSLYLGEQLLWVENCDCRRKTYEMSLISATDWDEWMLEQNFFPCYHSYETEKYWKEAETLQKLEEKRFLVQMCKVETGEKRKEMVIYERLGKEYLMRKEHDTNLCIEYHQHHLLKELKRWMHV